FGAIGAFNDDGLAAFTDFLNGAVDGLHAVFADAIDFDAGFLGSLFGVMHDDFRAFLDALVRIFAAGFGDVGAMHGRLTDIVDRVLGAILGLHDDGLGAGVDLRHGAMHCGHDIVGS